MDVMAGAGAVVNFFTGTVLPFLFVLTIIVFFHELGHFLVARWNKVKIDAFAVGFGPELLGFNDRHGTRWKLCAIPLGGYVKFFGDENAASKPDHERLQSMSDEELEGAFENKAVWRRALVVVAGPVANFLLAIVIYSGLFMIHDDVQVAPVFGEIQAGSAAEAAGFKADDRVIKLNGQEITSFRQISETTMMSGGDTLHFVVVRNGEEIAISANPRVTEQVDRFGNTYKVALIGVRSKSGAEYLTVTSLGPVDAFTKAVSQTWIVTKRTLYFLADLIRGKQDASELRGPLGIGQVTSQVATLGIAQLLSLAGVISISIGLMNLFPIPMLDGGHLVFYAIEAIRGRALSQKTMDIAFKFGMLCVLALMVFATSNDITRFLG